MFNLVSFSGVVHYLVMVKNPKLLKELRKLPCVVCSRPGPNDVDHIRSKGSGGDDSEHNLWTLCRSCHMNRHSQGLTRFVLSRPHARQILFSKGWYLDSYLQKWRNHEDVD